MLGGIVIRQLLYGYNIVAFHIQYSYMEIRLNYLRIAETFDCQPVTVRVQAEGLTSLQAEVALLIDVQVKITGIVLVLREVVGYGVLVGILTNIHHFLRDLNCYLCICADICIVTISYNVRIQRIRDTIEVRIRLCYRKLVLLRLAGLYRRRCRFHVAIDVVIIHLADFQNIVVLTVLIFICIRNGYRQACLQRNLNIQVRAGGNCLGYHRSCILRMCRRGNSIHIDSITVQHHYALELRRCGIADREYTLCAGLVAAAKSTEVLQRIVYAKYPVTGALRTDRQSLNRKFMVFF